MFGRQKSDPVIDPVSWDRAGHFLVGDVLRPPGLARKAVRDRRAVRFPTEIKGVRYYAPSVLVTAAGGETPSYALHDATAPDVLLCALTPEESGARYRVTDADGAELGLIHRTPAAKRTLQHTWWFQQAGHPDVVARYHWARGSAKEIVGRGRERLAQGAGAAVGGVVAALLDGSEGGDQPARAPRPVTWRTQDETETVVLTSVPLEGVRTYLPHAPWLDRRLAFAVAVLREA
ncbi:hypothetical protein C3489_04925 [Streptomyces sp. Ru71]|uniref:hypothetical protein n=1 Tax=Streptomyces sp. Ru71 TaxID=2080746 RepID=UPI000CDE209F|nr:hypothetical protein [Streptomyces sp. Ru71]POX56402.1 hypothetical protein C3489_04925 [Streptomyces sp. Ru71]